MIALSLTLLIKVNIWIFVVGDVDPFSLSEYLGFMRYKYAEIGVEPVFQQVIPVPDFFPRIKTVNRRFKIWTWLLSEGGATKSGRLVHVLFKKKRGVIRSGKALRCSYKRKNAISISEVADRNELGEPRGLHSAYDLTKQTAKSLGVMRTEDISVSSNELLDLVTSLGYSIPWGPKASEQIQNCIYK